MTRSIRRVALPASLFLSAAILGGGCDLSTKHWAEETLADEPGQSMTVVDQYVDLSLQYNEGTAFSFVRDLGLARLVFGIFSILVVIALFVVVVRHPQHRWRALGFGVVAGGALGNGLDRIFRDGVVDFIVVHYPWGGSWPTFNIADVLVAVGVAILLIEGIATRTRPPAGAAGATG
ncbi:MAG: signal peptidase II [Myxococcales bacterium]|nr:signal peptidase II [Myxococcales bacterium]